MFIWSILAIIITCLSLLGYLTTYIKSDVFFSTLFGALFGALFAFFLDYVRTIMEEKKTNTTALFKTKYLIEKIKDINLCVYNTIQKGNIEDETLDWSKIPTHDMMFEIPPLPINQLTFLLHSKKADISLDDILRVDAEFQCLLNLLNRRNENYTNMCRLVNLAEKSNSYNRLNMPSGPQKNNYLKEAIGQRLFDELDNDTKLLIQTNSNLSDSCEYALKNFKLEI